MCLPGQEELKMNRILTAVALTSAGVLTAQMPEQPVVITLEIENAVLYRGNSFDISRIAKVQPPTTSVNISFLPGVNVGDIVSVNGKAARGTFFNTFVALPFRANPAPGQPIADIDGTADFHCVWHVLAADGTYVGTIQDNGSGPSPEHVVTGGAGAFFGVTGVHRTETIVASRGALTEEDPANRRVHGGGKFRSVFHLYPRFRPQLDMTPAGPAIFHAEDFTPVTAANPVRAGETLIARATGLGPTRSNLQSIRATPFKADPVEMVNSPIEVTVNGKEAEVINKVGWPGRYDLYRVDFRVPAGIPPGMATIQLTAAWIPGPEAKIPVQ
jgi:hypothetical protein